MKFEEGNYYVLDFFTTQYIFKLEKIDKNNWIDVSNILQRDTFQREVSKRWHYIKGQEQNYRECTIEELTWIRACERAQKLVSLEEALQGLQTYEIY